MCNMQKLNCFKWKKKEVISKVLATNSIFYLFLTKFKGQLEYPALQSECPLQSGILGIPGLLASTGCDCLCETLPRGQPTSVYVWIWHLSEFHQLFPCAPTTLRPLCLPLCNQEKPRYLPKRFKGSHVKTVQLAIPKRLRPISSLLFPFPDTSLATALARRAVTELWGPANAGINIKVSVCYPRSSVGRNNLYPDVKAAQKTEKKSVFKSCRSSAKTHSKPEHWARWGLHHSKQINPASALPTPLSNWKGTSHSPPAASGVLILQAGCSWLSIPPLEQTL